MRDIDLETPIVLDIECARWTDFVIGCLLEGGEDGQPWTTTDPARLIDRVLRRCRGKMVWAHAGGRYDWLWFIDHLTKRGIEWKAVSAGGSVVMIEVGRGADAITLCDSYRLWPDPLARIGELLGLPKLEVGLPCVCGKGCGGYCSIDHQHAGHLREYLIRDCRVLAKALRWVWALCKKHGIPLRRTVGSTAWADAEEMLGLPRADSVIDLATALLLRDGYYGGRVEAYKLRAERGRSYDIHSAYPWALASTPVSFTLPDFKRRSNIDRAGIYWARVRIPETDLPPLPYRDRDSHRLAFTYGVLDGAWTHIELNHAIECGAKIEKIKASATWVDEKVWFDRWYQARASLRTMYGYRSAEGEWLKWLINSFTGKLAQYPLREDVQIGEPPCICKRGLICECREALDPEGKYWARKRSSVAPSGHVMVAAILTSVVRVEGHSQLMPLGDGRVYIDTDGIYASGGSWDVVPVPYYSLTDRRRGDLVGEWGDEGPWENWECHAPKVYKCDRPDWIDEKGEIVKSKGAKYRVKGAKVRDQNSWDAYTKGRGVEVDGVRGLLGAIRSGESLFSRRVGADGSPERRKLAAPGPLVGSRWRDGDVTRALSFSDYREITG